MTLPSFARILTSKFVAAVWKRSRFISEKGSGADKDSIAMAKSKIGTSCRAAFASSFLCKLGVAAIASALSVTSVVFAAQPTWTMLTPATPNGFPQYGFDGSQSSAYDSANDRLIVFGGQSFNSSAVSHETWLLENASGAGGTPTWRQLSTTNDPPGRLRHSAVYDPSTNRMIIFGGTDGGGSFFHDVWILKNANGLGGAATWISRTPATPVGSPAGRSQHGAIYDQASNAMAIFFGSDPAGTMTWSDVWVLQDANDLVNQPTWHLTSQTGNLPSPVGHFATAYDPVSHRVTIFGGCCGYSNATFVGALDTSIPSVQWSALSPGGVVVPAGDVSTFGYDRTNNNLIVLDISSDGANGTWLLTDANGIGGAASWNSTVPGSSNTPPHGAMLIGSAYSPQLNTFVDALNVVNGTTLSPEVWILRSQLAFPLLNLDAYSADIISVFDHTMRNASGKYQIYACDNSVLLAQGSVQAYTGELGDVNPDVKFCSQHPGYQNQARTPFVITGNGHYVGANGDSTHLNYDGHPGCDYVASFGTPVYAATDGVVHYPGSICSVRGTRNDPDHADIFDVLEIVPNTGLSDANVYYLHLSTHPRTISLHLTQNSSGQDFVASTGPQPISECPSSLMRATTPTSPPPSGSFSISGTITLGSAGLAGVSVELTGLTEKGVCAFKSLKFTTGSDGTYTFTGIPQGWYHVRPVFAGYVFSPKVPNVIVNEGDVVRAGQLIGRSGNAGACLGPHLHFEVERKATPRQKLLTGLDFIPVDPYGWQGGPADPYTALSGMVNIPLWATHP